MGINFLLSRELKSSVAYESLEHLLDNDDFFRLKNIYCGNKSYTKEVQGEKLSYVKVDDNDVYVRVESYDNVLIECKVYNHHNNIKIRRRDFKEQPIKEDVHFYSYDFVTGNSYVSTIYRDVYRSKDGEKPVTTLYNKSVFNRNGDLIDFYKEENEDNKKRKYK